jgi:hypothetical protein
MLRKLSLTTGFQLLFSANSEARKMLRKFSLTAGF